MTKLSLLVLFSAGVVAPVALLGACATDNGDAVHGPQFGPPPERSDGGSEGSATGEGGGPGPDSGADADGAPIPTCMGGGIVAVLAGTDSMLSGAVQVDAGAWAGAAIVGGAARSAPSLVAFGTGFVGLTRGPADALQAVSYATSWSGVTSVGALTTLGTPALTVLGANAQAVYLSGTLSDVNKFSRIQNSATSWTTPGDPVKPSAGTQSFGPSAGTIAAAGTDLVFAQDGDDEGLYVRKWDGAAWSPEPGLAVSGAVSGAGTLKTAAPALVSVPGTFDLVLLYADNTVNHVIGFATRTAATKAWSSAAVTQATAQTSEAMSATLISPTAVLVTFRGNDGKPYKMTGTLGATSITWSAPSLLLADGSATVDSAPAVARGVCGDEAIAVFSSGGQVKATRLRAGSWSVPGPVAGASGTRVSVATR